METKEVNQTQKADSAIQQYKLKGWIEKWTVVFLNNFSTLGDNPTHMGIQQLL